MSNKINDNNLPISLNLKQNQSLPESTKKYFSICKEKLGLIPNVLKAHSFNIDKLNAFTGIYNELMLANSNLSKLEREMIAVVVSSINRCFYCLTAHGAAVRELSGDPILGEKLVMNFRTADLDPRCRAMLEFAEKVTIESHKVDETDRQNLRDVGFNDADIWDITNIIAFFNMSNRVASALNMKPNDDYHAKAR